jgi:hypothetical protein
MSIRTAKVSVTTTGSDGSATGTAYSASPLFGEVFAVRVDWHASAPGTSDIDVTIESDDNHPAVTLVDIDDSATDVWIYPVVEQTTVAGVGTSTYQHLLAAGRVKVVVGGSDALTDAVVVTVFARS